MLSKSILFCYYFFKFKSTNLAYQFASYQIPYRDTVNIKRSGNDLVFTKTGNKIPVERVHPYKEELRSLIAVLNDKHVQVVASQTSKGLVLKIDDILVNTYSVSNIFTLYEIYLEQLYNFSTPEGDNVILDIGMNVGYASLYFAALTSTSHVYSYEPFPQTFEEATNNIGLNAALHNKITPHNFGISNTSKFVEVPMMESGSAIASTTELFVEHHRVISDKNVRVEVKDIRQVLEEIIAKHPSQNLFLKVDCEGEEYGVMECLNGTNLIKKIGGFFIEWHIKGPDAIVEVLNRNGFVSLHIPRVGIDSGMIYAFKKA